MLYIRVNNAEGVIAKHNCDALVESVGSAGSVQLGFDKYAYTVTISPDMFETIINLMMASAPDTTLEACGKAVLVYREAVRRLTEAA